MLTQRSMEESVMRFARPAALMLTISIALPLRAQTFFEYQVRKEPPAPVNAMTESLTFSVDGADSRGFGNWLITFSPRFFQEATYWRQDSVELRAESYVNPIRGDTWPHDQDHTLAVISGESGPLYLTQITYDTLIDSKGRRESIQSAISWTEAEKLLTANIIEVHVGHTICILSPDQIVALRPFLKRTLVGPFAP
jgi:hypothetical protein